MVSSTQGAPNPSHATDIDINYFRFKLVVLELVAREVSYCAGEGDVLHEGVFPFKASKNVLNIFATCDMDIIFENVIIVLRNSRKLQVSFMNS
jgi:hypothetical protein